MSGGEVCVYVCVWTRTKPRSHQKPLTHANRHTHRPVPLLPLQEGHHVEQLVSIGPPPPLPTAPAAADAAPVVRRREMDGG